MDVTAKEKIAAPIPVPPVQSKSPETSASVQQKNPASYPNAK
jgi:hypothetical protein